MGRFDMFVGHLKCPVCGTVSDADASTDMQTKIRDFPDLSYLSVGTELGVKLNNYVKTYDMLAMPKDNEPISILIPWYCSTCKTGYKWAHIIVKDNFIEDIKDVCKNKETLLNTHFVDSECIYYIQYESGYEDLDLSSYKAEELREKLISLTEVKNDKESTNKR